MPTARSGGAAVYYNGLLIYAGGECKKRDPNAGFGGGEDFDENEGYDPKGNTWRTLAKLPSARQAFGAATVGSAAYFPGGTLRCGGSCPHGSDAGVSIKVRGIDRSSETRRLAESCSQPVGCRLMALSVECRLPRYIPSCEADGLSGHGVF